MRSIICVHERYERNWSFTADYWHERWKEEGDTELYRSEDPKARITELVSDPATVTRLVILGFPAESEDLTPFLRLKNVILMMAGTMYHQQELKKLKLEE